MSNRGVKPKPKPRHAGPTATPFALPDGTSDEVRAEFDRLASRLREVGTFDQTDPLMLLLAARSAVLIDRAWLDVEREGTTLPTNNGMSMSHPMIAVIANHGAKLRALLSDMGLTPATAKLGAAKGQDDANPWAGLLSVTG